MKGSYKEIGRFLVPFRLFDCFGFNAGAAPILSGDDPILFPVCEAVVLEEM